MVYDPGGVWADVLSWAIALLAVLALSSVVWAVDMLIDRLRPRPRHTATTAPRRRNRTAGPEPPRRSRTAGPEPPLRDRTATTVPELGRGREWDLVMRRAHRELARIYTVEALHADAAAKIAAAEYAHKRLVIDCTGVFDMRPALASQPAEEPACAPAPAAERKSLAA